MTISDPSSTTTARPRYPNTREDQDYDFKSHLMNMTEIFKKDINNFLKEI